MRLFVVDKWKIIKYFCAICVISFTFFFANSFNLDFIATIAGGERLLPIYNIKTDEAKIEQTQKQLVQLEDDVTTQMQQIQQQ